MIDKKRERKAPFSGVYFLFGATYHLMLKTFNKAALVYCVDEDY